LLSVVSDSVFSSVYMHVLSELTLEPLETDHIQMYTPCPKISDTPTDKLV